MSADQERDLVFLPTSGPSPDYYGGTRPGDNRYADSIVALRGATGEVAWYFQTIHHDVWDYDNTAQPTQVELTKDGKPFPAVIQATKTGMLYIFNRETGEPLLPHRGAPGAPGWRAGRGALADPAVPGQAAAARAARVHRRRLLGHDALGSRRCMK